MLTENFLFLPRLVSQYSYAFFFFLLPSMFHLICFQCPLPFHITLPDQYSTLYILFIIPLTIFLFLFLSIRMSFFFLFFFFLHLICFQCLLHFHITLPSQYSTLYIPLLSSPSPSSSSPSQSHCLSSHTTSSPFSHAPSFIISSPFSSPNPGASNKGLLLIYSRPYSTIFPLSFISSSSLQSLSGQSFHFQCLPASGGTNK